MFRPGPIVVLALLTTACGSAKATATAPTTLTPVEKCTESVMAALSVPFDGGPSLDAAGDQLAYEYGISSPEWLTYAAVIAPHVNGFQEVRDSEGIEAALDYVRPYVSNGCAADWSTRGA
jgi:hypothetical protein